MKNILAVLLISCFCLNFISCTATTNTAETGTYFFSEVKGTWSWHLEGDENTEGKYVGEIKKGKPHGQGTYTHYSGPRSSVNQLSMLIPGMPTSIIFMITIWQLLNQSSLDQLPARYEGNWNRGEKYGQGTYFFPNGDKYEGKWEGGIKYGQGTYFFSEGDTFVGQWKDGKPHGKGLYPYPSGEK